MGCEELKRVKKEGENKKEKGEVQKKIAEIG